MKKIILIIAILIIVATGCSIGNNAIEQVKPLSKEDFVVNYNGLEFDDTYPIYDLINTLGISKGDLENNYGLISQGQENGYKRWGLSYPEADKPQMSLTIMGDGLDPSEGDYLAEVSLIEIETSRGIKVGDSSEKVINAYGKPDKKIKGEVVQYQYIYSLGSKQLIFDIDKSDKVVGITYDYNMKKAYEDQGFSE